MLKRKRGKIVFINSLLTFQGGITVPGGGASKGAVDQLTMAFENEWASSGININAIAPGYVNTDNTEALKINPERVTSILARIPANRWGEPEGFGGPVGGWEDNYLNIFFLNQKNGKIRQKNGQIYCKNLQPK